MNERKNRYLTWGMLLGMSIGSSIATSMYAETKEPFYFGLIGVGLAFGLLLGTALDKERRCA
jgi:hypothetical protein